MQVGAERAADASAGQLDHVRTGIFKQGAIDADVAKLIDQDNGIWEVGFPG